jgi:hypothetical protein
MTAPVAAWRIPKQVWFILLSWGLAVMVLAGLFSFWTWSNQQERERQNAAAKYEQDRAMCSMTSIFLTGPEPVPGPAGERSRTVRAAMIDYRAVLGCDRLVPPR